MPATDQIATRDQIDERAALSSRSFARFAGYITSELGIKMPASKVTMVQSRLLRRVRELRLESVEQYAEYFFNSDNTKEREHFINAITTNKTDFFREPEHFAFLTSTVLPAFTANSPHGIGRFKAWSAGSSSGEEAYTLAMVLAEYERQQSGFSYAILGTDISTRVLQTARQAIYQESQVAPVAPELRRRYLLRSRSTTERLARVIPDLRKRVSFHQLNFMDDHFSVRDMFDAIFFRNVMIYFERRTQEAVIQKLCRNLVPGGYFFAGHSESLASLNVPLKAVRTSIFRKPI